MIISNDVIYRNRRAVVTFTLLDANGDVLPVAGSGSIELKMGTSNNVILTVESGVPTANGSYFPFENPFNLVLSEQDMNLFTAGIWTVEVLAVDAQDRTFHIESKTMEVRNPLP